ncbi:hypothetical protein [Kushneria aurantia]|uniref:Uncharacterized protein n=1 Tax=Kushneria aurantia TaxID=504092 RepID=A0ABV6G1L4_9GAMM|nr:hypothetical protein [Kushneria aurantia]
MLLAEAAPRQRFETSRVAVGTLAWPCKGVNQRLDILFNSARVLALLVDFPEQRLDILFNAVRAFTLWVSCPEKRLDILLNTARAFTLLADCPGQHQQLFVNRTGITTTGIATEGKTVQQVAFLVASVFGGFSGCFFQIISGIGKRTGGLDAAKEGAEASITLVTAGALAGFDAAGGRRHNIERCQHDIFPASRTLL